MTQRGSFCPDQQGDRVRLHLDRRPEDAEQPVRRLYWLRPQAGAGGWAAWFPAEQVQGWLDLAVAADLPAAADGQALDKRAWRLATRFVPARLRDDPPALGVDAELLGDVRWEPT